MHPPGMLSCFEIDFLPANGELVVSNAIMGSLIKVVNKKCVGDSLYFLIYRLFILWSRRVIFF